jgi:hypothetical protein
MISIFSLINLKHGNVVVSVVDCGLGMEKSCISISELDPFDFPPLFPVGFLILKKGDDMRFENIS